MNAKVTPANAKGSEVKRGRGRPPKPKEPVKTVAQILANAEDAKKLEGLIKHGLEIMEIRRQRAEELKSIIDTAQAALKLDKAAFKALLKYRDKIAEGTDRDDPVLESAVKFHDGVSEYLQLFGEGMATGALSDLVDELQQEDQPEQEIQEVSAPEIDPDNDD